MFDEIRDAVRSLGHDGVGAIVVWGGESVFAAGADVSEFIPTNSETASERAGHIRAALDGLAAFDGPTIAAITGFALGGGLETALACDFRIASNHARLGFPEILLGIMPGGGGTQRATRLIGVQKAKELIFTGRHIRASEALDIGLIDRIVDSDAVYGDAIEWARQMASGPRRAIAFAKRAIDGATRLDLAAGFDLERDCFVAVFDSEDATIGIRSFLDNGPGKAEFTGR